MSFDRRSFKQLSATALRRVAELLLAVPLMTIGFAVIVILTGQWSGVMMYFSTDHAPLIGDLSYYEQSVALIMAFQGWLVPVLVALGLVGLGLVGYIAIAIMCGIGRTVLNSIMNLKWGLRGVNLFIILVWSLMIALTIFIWLGDGLAWALISEIFLAILTLISVNRVLVGGGND